MSHEVSQTGNAAEGDIFGGDKAGQHVIKPQGDYVENKIVAAPPKEDSALAKLFKKLKNEAAEDSALCAYIAELEIYTRTVQDEKVIGLDGKLGLASRIDQLDMAKHLKEMVFANLRRNMFSKTFQTIYATLMAKVYEEFDTWVKPAIASGKTRQEIDTLVHQKVIKPIAAELEQCEEFDGVAISTVRGMLYFLTGNCHVVWH